MGPREVENNIKEELEESDVNLNYKVKIKKGSGSL